MTEHLTTPSDRTGLVVDLVHGALRSEDIPSLTRLVSMLDLYELCGTLDKLDLSEAEAAAVVELGMTSEVHRVLLYVAVLDKVGSASSLGKSEISVEEMLGQLPESWKLSMATNLLRWGGWWARALRLDEPTSSGRPLDRSLLSWCFAAGADPNELCKGSDQELAGETLRTAVPMELDDDAIDLLIDTDAGVVLALDRKLNVEQTNKLLAKELPATNNVVVGLLKLAQRGGREVADQVLAKLENMELPSRMRLNTVDAGMFFDALGGFNDAVATRILSICGASCQVMYLYGHLEGAVPSFEIADLLISQLSEHGSEWASMKIYPSQMMNLAYRCMLIDKIPGAAWRLFSGEQPSHQELIDHVHARLRASGCQESVAWSLFNDRIDLRAEQQITLNQFCELLGSMAQAIG